MTITASSCLARRWLIILLLALGGVAGCEKKQTGSSSSGDAAGPDALPPSSVPTVDVTFLYGSEKKSWITDVTRQFNSSQARISNGKVIRVRTVPLGSGETIDEVLAGRQQADAISPASAAFITLGNAQSKAKTGKDLVGPTQNLVVSPVVIGMWRPMAEALGWGAKPVGWTEILSLARNPKGWAAYGHPEWGKFKFGHTHPEYSNSGLISVLAEVYAAAGKKNRLTADDISTPQVASFLDDIEGAVVHYGSSTGFFSDRMFANGPSYLSAAVMYENLVTESYRDANRPTQMPVVAIYPREGTFWSDHPAGVVQRDWVTPERKEAAEAYIKFLLDKPQQEKALVYGFRPGDPSLALAAPIDAAHGVDPAEPKSTLEVPPAEVMDGVISLWRQHKKHANIVLVLDVSGSMNDDNKLVNAKQGAKQLFELLGDEDSLSLLPFSSDMNWISKGVKLKDGRDGLNKSVEGLVAEGQTRLYDSIDTAYQYVTVESAQPSRISAIVVLTDGEDNKSTTTLDALIARVRPDEEKRPVRIFTIGYGNDARTDVLQRIADETRAQFRKGTPDNIRQIFKEIATFF